MLELASSVVKNEGQWYVNEMKWKIWYDPLRSNCKLEFMLIFYVKWDVSKCRSCMWVCVSLCLVVSRDY